MFVIVSSLLTMMFKVAPQPGFGNLTYLGVGLTQVSIRGYMYLYKVLASDLTFYHILQYRYLCILRFQLP